MDPTTQPPIVYEGEKITEAQLHAFQKAIGLPSSSDVPTTFATRFRKAEFQWLDRVQVDMRNLLHTEQEFEFIEPLKVGDVPQVSTRVTEVKTRRSMRFFTLVTEVQCQGVLKVRSNTSFVVRG